MHNVIIITIITVIVIIQLRSYRDTNNKINRFLNIFPHNDDEYKLKKELLIEQINTANDEELQQMLVAASLQIVKYKYSYKKSKQEEGGDEEIIAFRRDNARKDLITKLNTESNGIKVLESNSTLTTIVESINNYLRNNKTVSDFHLMKDIVDRNCDSQEDEINTQIPIPLYMGLVGTMLGILVGVGILAFGGGLSALLSSDIPQWFKSTLPGVEEEIIRKTWSTKGSDGVIALMGGVAMAMASSVLGIVLTTVGSTRFKNAKSKVESKKHVFLSWIQAKLLPTLSDNVVGAIREMTINLDNFNREFALNTGNLGSALNKVNESYNMQVRLLDAVQKISNKDLTSQNLQLYNALQNSADHVGIFAQYLKECNDYLANVQALNKKLDDYEKRTQFIEKASQFYSKHELWLSENYDEANRALNDVVGKYNKTIEEVFKGIKTDIESKRQELGTFIESQNQALKSNNDNFDKIVKSLSELGEVQKAIRAFEDAIVGQNRKIDNLVNNLEKWSRNFAQEKTNYPPSQLKQNTPMWQIAIWGLIAVSCMVLVVKSFYPSKIKMENAEFIKSEQFIQQSIDTTKIDSVKVKSNLKLN